MTSSKSEHEYDAVMGLALDEARAALGEDEYLTALGRGAELSLDETVTYVFSVLDVAALAVP